MCWSLIWIEYYFFSHVDMEFPIFDVYRENEIKLQTTDVKEGKVLQLSCFVEGNPTPKVQISKVHKSRDIVLLESNGHWSNYSFKREVTCLDSGVYACSARTEELQSKRNEIFLNILCEYLFLHCPWFTFLDVKAIKSDIFLFIDNCH